MTTSTQHLVPCYLPVAWRNADNKLKDAWYRHTNQPIPPIPDCKLDDRWLDWEWSEGDPKLLQALAELRAKRSQEQIPIEEDTWAASFEEYHQ